MICGINGRKDIRAGIRFKALRGCDDIEGFWKPCQEFPSTLS
jgi:hypothetical protein